MAAKEKDNAKANLEAFQLFQEATRKGTEARAAILKGVKDGTPIEDLFLIATDCIGALCDNAFFADQVREALAERLGTDE